jgi:tetratricopeptide (TPR) repeat protein
MNPDTLEGEPKRKVALEYFQKAYQHQIKGELEEAIVLYQMSIETFPTAEAHTFLGWAYSFLGQYEEAIGECYKAIEIDPDLGNPYNDIGAYLIEKGELDAAIPWLEKAIGAKRYESFCFPHLNLGRIWEKKGEWFKAVEEYQKALEANPRYIVAQKALKRLVALMN